MVDFTSLLAAFFVFLGNLLLAIWIGVEKSKHNYSWSEYRSLDPDYLQELWVNRGDMAGVHLAGSFIVALSWVVLCVPIVQVAFILSQGGKQHIWLHTMMVVLAISAATTEFIARLIHVGTWDVGSWIQRDFELDDWAGDKSNPNGIGWKSLEISFQLGNGMLLWVDGWEYFAIFGIMILIFLSVKWSRSGILGEEMGWAGFGFFIGCLSLVEFIFLFLRFVDYNTFSLVSTIFTVMLRLIMLPVWLILLAFKLTPAVQEYKEKRYGNITPSSGATTLSSPANGVDHTPSPGDFTISD